MCTLTNGVTIAPSDDDDDDDNKDNSDNDDNTQYRLNNNNNQRYTIRFGVGQIALMENI